MIMALIAAICGGEYYYVSQTYTGKLSTIQQNVADQAQELASYDREVEVAARDIKAGEQLIDTAADPTDGNMTLTTIKSDADISLYFSPDGNIEDVDAVEDVSTEDTAVEDADIADTEAAEAGDTEEIVSEEETEPADGAEEVATPKKRVSGNGARALVDITAGTPILLSMVSDEKIQKDTRIVDVNVVELQKTQEDNDIVDIRALFPDGTDYIVFSKQQIRNLNGTDFQLYLNEDQIQTLDSATVDAAKMGARLYTVKYVQNQLQDAAIPFYPVRQETIDLISSDPNVLTYAKETMNKKARQALEERLPQTDADGNPVVADVSTEETPAAEAEATDEAVVEAQ